MKKIYSILLISSLLQFSSSPVLHASPQSDLEKTRKDIEEVRARQSEMAKQNQALEAELKGIQERLVQLAETIQTNEAGLSSAEDKLRILGEQMAAREATLKDRRRQLSGLVQAALALSRTPPEAMLMMPGDLDRTMKAARALKMLSDGIRSQTEALGQQLAELHQLQQKVEQGREEAGRRQGLLDKERATLAEKLEERKGLREQLGRQQVQESEAMKQLAQKAEGLQELMNSLAEEEAENRAQAAQEARPSKVRRPALRSFAAAKAHLRPPAAGKVVQLFGKENSKGILIATPPKAQVMAPYDGEVVFTGPFLTYGQMVIIRHSDDFHTLLAGLSKIDATVGQFLLEGEPIGAMGENETTNRLYMELRQNNKPVDPAPWLSGLSKYKE